MQIERLSHSQYSQLSTQNVSNISKINYLSRFEECGEKEDAKEPKSSCCFNSFLESISKFFKNLWTYITRGCCFSGSKIKEEEKKEIAITFVKVTEAEKINFRFAFENKTLACVQTLSTTGFYEDTDYYLDVDHKVFGKEEESVQQKVVESALEVLLKEENTVSTIYMSTQYDKWIDRDLFLIQKGDEALNDVLGAANLKVSKKSQTDS